MEFSHFYELVAQLVRSAVPEAEVRPIFDREEHRCALEVRLSLPDSMPSPVYDITGLYEQQSPEGEVQLISAAKLFVQKLMLAQSFAKEVRESCRDYAWAKPRLRCTVVSKEAALRQERELGESRAALFTAFGGGIVVTYGLEVRCPEELGGVLGGDRIVVPVTRSMLLGYGVTQQELDQIARIRSAALNPLIIKPVERCGPGVWSVMTEYYSGAAAITYPTFYAKVSKAAGAHFFVMAFDTGWLFILPGSDPLGLAAFAREEYERTPEKYRLSDRLWYCTEKGIRVLPEEGTVFLEGRVVC